MRSARLFLKGSENGTTGTHSKGDCSVADTRSRLSGNSPDAKEFVMASMPTIEHIVDITDKLPKWMNIVKKKIARQGKDEMG